MQTQTVHTIRPPKGLDLPDLGSHDLTFQGFRDQINPFLVISLFDMTGPVFPPHPHAGFSVATYIFPESEVGFWNQDTIGTRNHIEPGALHWTTAGSGLMHEETVTRSGRHALGFQIWIDHAAHDRQVAPAGISLGADKILLVRAAGVIKRVLVGASGDVASPLAVPTAVRLIDVELAAGAVMTEGLNHAEKAFVWVRSGKIKIGTTTVGAGEVGFVSGETLTVEGMAEARFTFFAGAPIHQEIQPGGPFVGSNPSEIAAFRARFANGGMGRLTAFDQAAIDRDFDKLTKTGAAK
jgi:redox-sensitive bicupin YhaK (pirin superfamily)